MVLRWSKRGKRDHRASYTGKGLEHQQLITFTKLSSNSLTRNTLHSLISRPGLRSILHHASPVWRSIVKRTIEATMLRRTVLPVGHRQAPTSKSKSVHRFCHTNRKSKILKRHRRNDIRDIVLVHRPPADVLPTPPSLLNSQYWLSVAKSRSP